MPFKAIFLDATRVPYAGVGAHSVTAVDAAEADAVARMMLAGSRLGTAACGFRVVDDTGALVSELFPGKEG